MEDEFTVLEHQLFVLNLTPKVNYKSSRTALYKMSFKYLSAAYFFLNSKLRIKIKYPTNKIKPTFYFDILPFSPTYQIINLLMIPINIQKSKIQVFDI